MKIKIISAVYLVGFILASCAQTTPISPTKPPAPSVTSTIPAPSLTPSPTKILATPTETKPNNADFLARTENSFPLVVNPENGFASFTGMMDFSRPDFTVQTTPDGKTTIHISYPLDEGQVSFIVPALWNGEDSFYFPLTLFANASDGYAPGDQFIQKMNAKHLENLNVTGKKAKVKITLDTGSKGGTTTLLGYNEPFLRLWEASDWDEDVQKFIETGDWTLLPKINGKPVLPAVRIEVIP
jgi:hypothetical protein